MRTRLTDRVGIAHPIIQAPIGSATGPELVAAVSNAGGLGMLAASWLPLDVLRATLRAIRSLTSRPFGANLVLAWPQHDRLAVLLEEGVPVVSFFWGDPTPYAAAIRAAGALLCHTAGSTEEARQAADAGADIVVAQGGEAGGHVRGTVATMVLVPAIRDALPDITLVAAGGIADGRGLVAALGLGADGIWMGTRFVASAEARSHPDYRDRIARADDQATRYTTLFDGGWPHAPHRVLGNSTLAAWEAAGSPGAPSRPGEGEVVGRHPNGTPIHRYDDMIPVAGATGDLEAMALYAGQSAALVHDILPAAEIVGRVMAEAERGMARLAGLREPPVKDR
jgi:NAD(P)H-dependent flavin oxidoreductase YrpB (nitropropane dioxygenase family)